MNTKFAFITCKVCVAVFMNPKFVFINCKFVKSAVWDWHLSTCSCSLVSMYVSVPSSQGPPHLHCRLLDFEVNASDCELASQTGV